MIVARAKHENDEFWRSRLTRTETRATLNILLNYWTA